MTGFLLLCALTLIGCGSQSNEKVDSDASASGKEETKSKDKQQKNDNLGDYNVELAGEVTEEGDNFIVDGKTNLLPGSRVVGEVWVADNEKEPFSDSTEIVGDDGTFHMEIEHHKYGEAQIVIKFDLNGVQEDEIKRHYGDKGQKLEGPFIYKHKEFDGIFKKAEARIDYKPNESSPLTFKAPDWNELPNDYGDPRVWIEVDEITEDGEFFYLNGRSNILEGSVIKAEYGYNRDETQVKPDGSFDFKIEYEYLEDKDFIITFDPAGFQWNEIEEAYGKNGQKLIGDLVVQNKYNTDRQFIEKVIPWDEENQEGSNEEGSEAEQSEEKENNEK